MSLKAFPAPELARDGFCLFPTESLTQPVIQCSQFIEWQQSEQVADRAGMQGTLGTVTPALKTNSLQGSQMT